MVMMFLLLCQKIFWIKHDSILINKNIHIFIYKNNGRWKKIDIYFTCLSGVEDEYKYLKMFIVNNDNVYMN